MPSAILHVAGPSERRFKMRQDGRYQSFCPQFLIALAGISFLVGIPFLGYVRPGLPYDEPSHFNVVQLYASGKGLPVIGEPGVSYEAYHPPLYYALMAVPYRVAFAIGGERFAFYALRVLTLLIFSGLVAVVYLLAMDLTSSRPSAVLAAVFVACNPSILAIAASIQNDILVFLLATVASWLALRWCWDEEVTLRRSLYLGAIVSLAVLTKLSALPLIGFVGMLMLLRSRRQSLLPIALFSMVVLTMTGWWFLRNIRLYHDWTAGRAVASYFGGHPMSLFSLRDDASAIRSVITYYTLPVEYWRNEVKATLWMRGIVATASLTVLAGGALLIFRSVSVFRAHRRKMTRALLYLIFPALCIAMWIRVCQTEYKMPARAGMAGMAGVACIVGLSLAVLNSRTRGKRSVAVAIVLIGVGGVAINIALLRQANALPTGPYEIHFQRAVSAITASSKKF